jgi:sodium-coupled neutral amino acid transporter 9
MQDLGLEAIGLDARKGGTVASVTTAFSAWNAMAGMGMVSMPWAFQQAGIVLGCILTVVAFLLSYATCWIYVQTAGKDIDYTITMRKAMGPCGYVFGMASFIINLLVPVILLFQLQAQSLAPILLAITNLSESDSLDTSVNWDSFSYTWTCVIILVLEFIITLRRDLEIFIIMNTYGVLGIIILFCYLMTTGFISISQTEYTTSESYYDSHKDEISNLALIELFAAMYASLMGILGGGFYFHNLSIPVIAKNPEPKNNNRDLFFGYLLVCITYLMFGVVGYLGFMGQSYDDYRDENNDIN